MLTSATEDGPRSVLRGFHVRVFEKNPGPPLADLGGRMCGERLCHGWPDCRRTGRSGRDRRGRRSDSRSDADAYSDTCAAESGDERGRLRPARQDPYELRHERSLFKLPYSGIYGARHRRSFPVHLQTEPQPLRRSDRIPRSAGQGASPYVLRQHRSRRELDLRKPADHGRKHLPQRDEP